MQGIYIINNLYTNLLAQKVSGLLKNRPLEIFAQIKWTRSESNAPECCCCHDIANSNIYAFIVALVGWNVVCAA